MRKRISDAEFNNMLMKDQSIDR
jgi:hypothetical protein